MDEVQKSNETEVQVPQVYLRLEGVYQGDVQMGESKYITAMLFHLKDLNENMYLAPVTCKKEHFEEVRLALSRIFPISIAFTEDDGLYEAQGPKAEGLASVTAMNDKSETTH